MSRPNITLETDARPSGVWDYISPSRLNLWLKCPLAFRLRYIDGLTTPTSPAALVGKVVHAALELFYRHHQLGLELAAVDLQQHVLDSWDETVDAETVSFASVVDEQANRQQATDLVQCYLVSRPQDESRPLAVELQLEVPLVDPTTGEDLGIPLLGIVDLVLAEPEGPVIADFKTTARGGTPLPMLHEIQLGSYSYLFRDASGQTESRLEIRNLVKTKTPKLDVHRYPTRTDAHFGRLFAVIRAYLDSLDTGRFVFRPGLGCTSCDFRDTGCRVWSG